MVWDRLKLARDRFFPIFFRKMKEVVYEVYDELLWNENLPHDHLEIISRSTTATSLFLSSLSKRQLYFHLCDNPIIINNGTMSFSLDIENGKNCYMIGARGLTIARADEPSYWTWESLQESRFPEVALLNCVYGFDIKGKLDTKLLSPATSYAAYFVFKFADNKRGFDARPVVLGVERQDGGNVMQSVFLDQQGNDPRVTRERGDGWMEVEMGELYIPRSIDEEVAGILWETDDYTTKQGLIIEGIEFRPKHFF